MMVWRDFLCVGFAGFAGRLAVSARIPSPTTGDKPGGALRTLRSRSRSAPPSNPTPRERNGLNGPSSCHRSLQRSIRRSRARRTDSVCQAPGTVVLLWPPHHRTPLWTPVLFPVSLLAGSGAPRRSLSLWFSSCLHAYTAVLSS
ncbi:hypothetical protein H1C71_034823, partial [Ictidomys tridecemlineatus]